MIEITPETMRWVGFVYVGIIVSVSMFIISTVEYVRTKRRNKRIQERLNLFTTQQRHRRDEMDKWR